MYPLYKVTVVYELLDGTRARSTLVVAETGRFEAGQAAENAVRVFSGTGVAKIINTMAQLNEAGVEFLGRMPA